MKIFIVNGQGGAGKSTFEYIIQKYAWEEDFRDITITSIIDPIKAIAKEIGWDGGKTSKDRAFLHELKVLLHNYNNCDTKYIINKINNAEALKRTAIFIDMREKEDIADFKDLFPEIKTVLIKRGEFSSYGNEADDNVSDINYDIVIENNGTLEDFEKKAIEFYKKEIVNEV